MCSAPTASPLNPDLYKLPAGLTEKVITKEYKEKAVLFLRKNFFTDEPLNLAVGLVINENETCQELEDYCNETIDKGLSIMVLDKKGEIVAAGLYGILRRDEKIEDHSESCKNPKFKKILQLLHKIAVESDYFSKCPDLDATLDVKLIAVSESCRGQGLGYYLLHKAIDVAKSKNLHAIRTECTSAFSAKIMEKMGSVKIYELKYEDYKCDGKSIFKPPSPHDKVAIYYNRF